MILVIGDSFTYGEELTNRTKDAWPFLLSFDVKNLGKSGSSLDRIFRLAIEETSKQNYELVIIAWSFPNRLEVYEDGEPTCINTGNFEHKYKWAPEYFKYSYDEIFSFRKWFTQILALQGYFESINQPYLFCNVAGLKGHYKIAQNEFPYLLNKVNPKFYAGWPQNGMIEWAGDCPRGPNGHPLELGHQRIAQKINEHIRNISRRS
jgi:hypothetical protein